MLGHWNTQRNSPILRPSRGAADTTLSSNASSLKDHAATRCDCLVGQCMPFPINSSISPNCQAGIASPKSAIKSPESAARAHCPQSPTPIRRTGPIGAQVTPAAEWQRSGHRSPWQSGPVGHRGGPRRQPRGGTAHARVGPLARRGFQAPRRFGGRRVQVIGPHAPGEWHRTQDREERGSPAGHGIQGGPRQGHSAVKGDGGDPRRWTAAQTRHFWTTRSWELQGSGWTRSRSPAPCRRWRHGIPRVTQGGTGPSAIMIGERSGTAGSATRGSPL